MNEAAIGVFDSGVGGLTVARAIRDQLPHESLLYLGDLEHSPYGPKPIAEVRRFALDALDSLVSAGVKMLVIACNTASAATLRDARERFSVPVLEVIYPAVRSAVATTRTGKVGVIATAGTIASRAYDDAFIAAPQVELTTQACPRFVEFVEAGVTSGPELLELAREYLAPMKAANIDTLVLGCTHYPFLRGAISYIMGESVRLVSSDTATANDVYRTLISEGLERQGREAPIHHYEATGGSTGVFADLAERMLGQSIPDVELVATGAIPIQVAGRVSAASGVSA